MLQLIAGLVLFLGMHSASIVALPLRDRLAARSEIGWKAVYGLVSLAGLILIVRGYGEARLDSVVLYAPPVWLKHVAALLLLPVFILFLAPYLPGKIKKAAKHPQLVAVKLWALAHLLVNGTVADVVLFGSFLAWAVVDRISLKRRPVRDVPGAPESAVNDVILVIVGLLLYVATVGWLHKLAFGVAPFG
jgi:uncharacterized membrane protein